MEDMDIGFDSSMDIGDHESDISEGMDDSIDFDLEALESDMDSIEEVEEEMLLENLAAVEETSDTEDMSLEDMDNFIDSTDDIDKLNDLREALLEISDGKTVESELEELSLDELGNDNEDEFGIIEPELTVMPEEVEELINQETDPDRLNNLRDALQSGRIDVETMEDFDDGGSPKVLTREITPEILESRERDTEETLENYRDNLREYGVGEEKIEEFVNQEREKINSEYERLDHGDISSDIYCQPDSWEEVASSLMGQEALNEQRDEGMESAEILDQQTEQLNDEKQEMNINYDEIYEDIQREALEQGFEDIQIDADPERLDNSLEKFDESNWEGLQLDEQKEAITDLANYVVDTIGLDNPPVIEYYNNEEEGDFGGYDASSNTLHINEYMLYNSGEAADTVAHELWHAHQHECAMNPQNARDYQYQYNFENYISPELGQEAYEEQLVEAEARAFASQFKDQLSLRSGRTQ